MHRIVFDVVEKIAGADIGLHPQTFFLEIRIARQGRSIAFAEVNEDEAEIFFRWATADVYFFAEGFLLYRLLDALAMVSGPVGKQSM